MKAADAVKLIEKGITANQLQRWADLGCGSGTFTRALTSLLPIGSKVIAVDKELQNLQDFIRADFITDDLKLGALDGILMANSLHYVKDNTTLLPRFKVSQILIVEYDTNRSNPWVPYPVSYVNLERLAQALGYNITKLATHSSRLGGTMYSALLGK